MLGDSDIDWTLAPRRPAWLPRRHAVALASQLLLGEQAALTACRRLAAVLPAAHRPALARQIADEVRHVALYRRYLDRLGAEAPAAPATARAFAALDGWTDDPVALLLAVHGLLEREALAVQRDVIAWFPCPLLAAVTRRVLRDEARHVALGRRLLPAVLAPLDRGTRIALHGRLQAFWQDCAAAVAADHGAPLLTRALTAGGLPARWARHRRALIRIGLIDDSDPGFAAP